MDTTKSLARGVVVLSLVAVLSGYGMAAEQGMNPQRADQPALSQPPEQSTPSTASEVTVRRARQLIGEPVKNEQGKKLGTIYDLVLTPELNQVSYVALSRGGFFGIGRTLYAVPWSAMRIGASGFYTLPISGDELNQWRGFRSSSWPTEAYQNWGTAARTDETPQTATARRSVQDRRVSRVLGSMVKTPEGLNAGTVENLVIAMDSGNVLYTIVSFGGFLGIGSQYAAVPQGAINLEPAQRVAKLDVSRDVLRENAFAAGQYPNLGSSSYARSLDRAYGTEPGPEWAVLGFVPAREEPGAPQTQPEQLPTMDQLEPAATDYARVFEPSAVKTIEGTVTEVGRFPAGKTGVEGLLLRVQTDDGKSVMVYAGPRDYVNKQDFYAVRGDHISVTGAPMESGGRSIFLATRITKDGQTLQLRDQSGKPLWQMQAEQPEASRHTSPRPEGPSTQESETP